MYGALPYMVLGGCGSHPKVVVSWEVCVQDKLLHSVGQRIKQHILQRWAAETEVGGGVGARGDATIWRGTDGQRST